MICAIAVIHTQLLILRICQEFGEADHEILDDPVEGGSLEM